MTTINNSCLIRIYFDEMESIKGFGNVEFAFLKGSNIPEKNICNN